MRHGIATKTRRHEEYLGFVASCLRGSGYFLVRAIGGGLVLLPVLVFTQAPAGDQVSARAKQLHDRAIVVDSHDDTTQRLVFDKAFNLAARNKNGHIDIPRMREGGLDALFFSIWVPSDVTGAPAVKRALDQIDAVREAVRTHPHDLMLATTAADVANVRRASTLCTTSIYRRFRFP